MPSVRAPRHWVPGPLEAYPDGRGVVLRRRLLVPHGYLSVHERTCATAEEARVYFCEFGAPARCPPPWGPGKPVPDGWEGWGRS